eukprot:1160968-Pelagomonas_calceolata.AAC.3
MGSSEADIQSNTGVGCGQSNRYGLERGRHSKQHRCGLWAKQQVWARARPTFKATQVWAYLTTDQTIKSVPGRQQRQGRQQTQEGGRGTDQGRKSNKNQCAN